MSRILTFTKLCGEFNILRVSLLNFRWNGVVKLLAPLHCFIFCSLRWSILRSNILPISAGNGTLLADFTICATLLGWPEAWSFIVASALPTHANESEKIILIRIYDNSYVKIIIFSLNYLKLWKYHLNYHKTIKFLL